MAAYRVLVEVELRLDTPGAMAGGEDKLKAGVQLRLVVKISLRQECS